MKALLVLALAGCQADLTATRDPAALDRPYFDCRVQPVLTTYCAQLACHGDADRYFHVYARNRLRDGGGEAERGLALRETERAHNAAAASALVDLDDPEASLLLTKPLEGAAFHAGALRYLRGNVFATATDPDYQIIARWIAGATEDPTCQEPGSSL